MHASSATDHPMISKQEGTRSHPPLAWLGPWVALGFVTACFWLFAQRAHYLALESLALPRPTAEELLALRWTVWGETALPLVPCAFAASLALGRRRAQLGWALFVLGSSACLVFSALDLQLYLALGHHVSELLRFAFVPGALGVGGGSTQWALLVLRALLLSAPLVGASAWLGARIVAWVSVAASSALRRVLAGLVLGAVFALVGLPYFFAPFFVHTAVREGLAAELAWRPEFGASAQGSRANFSEPSWAALEHGLRASYARLFPLVFSQHRLTSSSKPGKRPNVLLIVVESFREDSLTPERMPRMFAWAQRGLFAHAHYGGSTYSEAGAFSLLYGRSPLLFDYTLDTHQEPTWCALAHQLALQCSYYSGHPKIWMRREEFLNPARVDHFVHDDRGDWNQWDRTALAGAVQAIRTPNAPPAFATVLLMSTHFEYQYPPEYARHLPVSTEASWATTNLAALDASNRAPLMNRYLNALAFTDDLVADAISALDPNETVIVFTGDHGESIGDDGRFGHGYGFPDVITRVPFAMVGPGIPPRGLEGPSLHSDVLRTLWHVLGQDTSGPAEARDLLVDAPPRKSLLLAHCAYSHDVADALLLSEGMRLRLELGLREPSVRLRFAEDSLGHALPTAALPPARVAAMIAAFEHELTALWQSEP